MPTASETHRGESLDERLDEEEPDISADDPDHSGAQPRAGRLVAPDEGAHGDQESDAIAYDAGPALSPRIRMLTSQDAPDLNPLLPAVDLLITDFSSVAYDFALTGRPIAFLAPDVAHYIATRGLYEKYSEFTGGTEVATWQGLLDLLTDASALARLVAHAPSLAARHHRYRDGENTSRVFDEIRTRFGAEV